MTVGTQQWGPRQRPSIWAWAHPPAKTKGKCGQQHPCDKGSKFYDCLHRFGPEEDYHSSDLLQGPLKIKNENGKLYVETWKIGWRTPSNFSDDMPLIFVRIVASKSENTKWVQTFLKLLNMYQIGVRIAASVTSRPVKNRFRIIESCMTHRV